MATASDPQENVRRLREFLNGPFTDMPALLEAWERGGADLSIFAEDIVYEDANLPDHVGEEYRGHEGLIRAARRWLEPFEELNLELERILGDGDRLVSVHSAYVKAKGLEIEFREPLAYIWTFRGGQVKHFRSIRDPAEAIEAAGLAEADPKRPD